MSVVEEPHVNGETVAEEAEQEMRSLLQKHLEWTLRPCLVQEGRVEWERACLNVAVAILKDIPRLLIGSSNTASKGRIHIVILDEVPIDEPFLFEYNPHSLSNDGVPYSQLTLKIRRNSLTHAEHLRTRQLLQWLVFVSSHTALELALLSDSGLPSILVSNKKSRHRHPGKKLTDAIHSSFRQSTASLWSWIQPELDRMGASRSTESLHRLSSGLPLLDMDGEHNDTETDSTSWDHISLEDAIQDLSRMAVSASPTVLFPPPFLLTKLRDRSTETDIEAFDSVKTPADLSLLDRVSWLFSLFTSHSQKQQRASSISLDSRAGLRYIMSDQNRILTMIKHQRILFSYASHILENTFLLPCVLPQLQAIEYYRFSTQPTHPGQDMTLLEYMKHCLETAHDPCQDLSCQLEAVDHVRTYTHYHFQISVSFKLETNQSPTSSDALFLWTVCRKCHSSTSMTQASNETRSYSFGKYLELLIYHPAFAPPSLCEHVDVNGSALRRAFCYKELIVYFDKDPIQLFEIQVSKVCLVNRPNLSEFNETPCSATHLSSSVSALSREVSQFYGTLKFYIAQIESSSQSPGSGDEKTLMMLQDMRMVFSEEHTHLLGTVKIQSLNELNAKRILFCACINRDKEMFESWQQEYAPWFKYEPYWEFPDYYKEPGSKLAPVGTLFPQNGIVLRSAEPMSIIAYTLLSRDYDDIFQKCREAPLTVETEWKTVEGLHSTKVKVFTHEEHISANNYHVLYKFKDDKQSFSCTVYYAQGFHELRRRCQMNADFPASLERCAPWNAVGGKSGADFFKSHDDKLIIKRLVKRWTLAEKEGLLAFTPSYLAYMNETDKKLSILAKIFGFYTVTYKNAATGQSYEYDYLVMEHLFVKQPVGKKFDLKGIPDRHQSKTKQPNSQDTGLDKDWLEGRYKALFRLHGHSRQILLESVENDTAFLASANIMDYSLLVGVHPTSNQLIVGIVDFIGSFTLYKQIEAKGKTILGGTAENVTVMHPLRYRDRFRKAIDQYFLVVPDKWTKLPHSMDNCEDALPPVV